MRLLIRHRRLWRRRNPLDRPGRGPIRTRRVDPIPLDLADRGDVLALVAGGLTTCARQRDGRP